MCKLVDHGFQWRTRRRNVEEVEGQLSGMSASPCREHLCKGVCTIQCSGRSTYLFTYLPTYSTLFPLNDSSMSCPYFDARMVSVAKDLISLIRLQTAMTITSQVLGTYMMAHRDAIEVPLSNGLRIQVLPSMEDLPRARKHQFAAFVASEGLLVVWDDDPNHMLTRGKEIEKALMDLFWDRKAGGEDAEFDEKKPGARVTEYEVDEEGEIITQRRPTNLQNSILVGCTIVLVAIMLGAGVRSVVSEFSVDKGYIRCAFLLLIPVQIFFTLVSDNLGGQPHTLSSSRNSSCISLQKVFRLANGQKVLQPGHSGLLRPVYRTGPSNEGKFEILFRCLLSSYPEQRPVTTYHCAMSRL